MNRTLIRAAELRSLGRRVERARSAAVQQTVEREAAIRHDGIAHPRSIRASRRLNRTLRAHRGLTAAYNQHASEVRPRYLQAERRI